MAWSSVGTLSGLAANMTNPTSNWMRSSAAVAANSVVTFGIAADNTGTTDADHSEISAVRDRPAGLDPTTRLSSGISVTTYDTFIATINPSGYKQICGIVGRSDKRMFSFAYSALAGASNDNGFGVGNSSASTSTDSWTGIDTNSIGWWGDGSVYYNGSAIATIATWAVNDYLDCCVDRSANLIWFRKNGGNWNNNASANPATGTGGITLSVTGTLFPMITMTNDAGTTGGQFLSSPEHGTDEGYTTYAVPSGFLAWDHFASQTWTKAKEYTDGNGGAQLGATASLWYCKPTVAWATGRLLECDFANPTTSDQSALTAHNWGIGAAGNLISVQATNQVANNSGGTTSLDATTPNAEFLRIRLIAREAALDTSWSATTSPVFNKLSEFGTTSMAVQGEYNISTGTGAASAPVGLTASDQSSIYVALKEANSLQDLTPGLVTDTDTFYAPKIVRGLLPALVTDTDTFYAPTVLRGSRTLTPALYTDTDTIYAARVVRQLRPGLYTDTDTFYSPTVTKSNTLQPALWSDADVFYAPILSRRIYPGLWSDADTIYAPSVGQDQILLPSLFSDDDMFYDPIVNQFTSIHPDADVSDGGWTNELDSNVDLYASVDENPAADADYIKSENAPVADIVTLGLSNPLTALSAPVRVRYRYRKEGTEQIDLTARLMEGATEIAEWVHTDIADTFVEASQELTGPQFAAITDFNALRIEFEANAP